MFISIHNVKYPGDPQVPNIRNTRDVGTVIPVLFNATDTAEQHLGPNGGTYYYKSSQARPKGFDFAPQGSCPPHREAASAQVAVT